MIKEQLCEESFSTDQKTRSEEKVELDGKRADKRTWKVIRLPISFKKALGHTKE